MMTESELNRHLMDVGRQLQRLQATWLDRQQREIMKELDRAYCDLVDAHFKATTD